MQRYVAKNYSKEERVNFKGMLDEGDIACNEKTFLPQPRFTK